MGGQTYVLLAVQSRVGAFTEEGKTKRLTHKWESAKKETESGKKRMAEGRYKCSSKGLSYRAERVTQESQSHAIS